MSNVSDQNQGYVQMPRYRCHKEVYALQIKDVEPYLEGWNITFVDDRYAARWVSREWFHKHPVEIGGYFVVYQDGYESFSPQAAFESGYTRLP